jgi:ATP-dependent DNA helicase PIF1
MDVLSDSTNVTLDVTRGQERDGHGKTMVNKKRKRDDGTNIALDQEGDETIINKKCKRDDLALDKEGDSHGMTMVNKRRKRDDGTNIALDQERDETIINKKCKRDDLALDKEGDSHGMTMVNKRRKRDDGTNIALDQERDETIINKKCKHDNLALDEERDGHGKTIIKKKRKREDGTNIALVASEASVLRPALGAVAVAVARSTHVAANSLVKSPSFSPTQQEALTKAKRRLNLVITGPAGTGKSFLYRCIFEFLVSLGLLVVRTATTGIAAVNVGGTTLHDFFGVGLGEASIDSMVHKVEQDDDLLAAWTDTDTLMCDEMSMLNPLYFAKMNEVAKRVRKSNKPFGGMQLIMFGDFLQLPAILKNDKHLKLENGQDSDDDDDDGAEATLPSQRHAEAAAAKRQRTGGPEGMYDRFARPADNNAKEFVFELALWEITFQETVELETIFRQTDDRFRALLNRARIGQLSEQDIRMLKARENVVLPKAVKLRSYRKDVQALNEAHIKSIAGEEYKFYSSHGYKWKDASMQGSELSPYKENLVKRLCKDCPAPAFLKLKVGVRVMFLHNENVSLGLVNGAQATVIDMQEFEVNGFVGDIRKYAVPIIQMERDGYKHTAKRICFMAQDRDVGYAYTWRIPLRLSAALTIHKSQGLQFDETDNRLDRSIFAMGQAYVGLSRNTSLEGLSIVGEFDPDCVKAHPKALMYYKLLRDKKRKRQERALTTTLAKRARN